MSIFRLKKYLRIIKEEFSYSKTYLKWLLKKDPLPKDEIKRIHIGCGEINYPGFINIDMLPAKHIHYLSNAENLNMFSDESIDLIYMSHCLEHFSYNNIDMILNEYYRKLKKGGVLRVSVPDFNKISKIYSEHHNLGDLMPVLYGGQDYEFNFHYGLFDKTLLESKLLKAGFNDVRLWEFGKERFKDLNDWSGKKAKLGDLELDVNLNIEASK